MFESPPVSVPVLVLVKVPALVIPPVVVTVPLFVNVPALFAIVVALKVRVADTTTAVADVELFVSVVMPVKLPPDTRS